jgi:hypothetical protein
LVLAALNRLAGPCCKRGFAGWWAKAATPPFTGVRAAVFDHRQFWDAMHAVSLAALEGHSSPAARDGRV